MLLRKAIDAPLNDIFSGYKCIAVDRGRKIKTDNSDAIRFGL
jgi:hypothetical protein